MPLKKNCFHLLMLLLLCAAMACLPGCPPQAQKPAPVKLAPEVRKYQQEPAISLYRTESGSKNNLQLEEYLQGVVAAEIGDEFPLEALKAQAIVARTMTLALMEYENGTRGKHGTDASDDHTEFQAYDPQRITPRIAQAVDATRGQVLIHNGKFAYALFHSASRNQTASIAEGFPSLKDKASYLVSVKTGGLKYAPAKYRKWTVRVPRSEIKGIMGAKAGSLGDIRVSQRGPSGRATVVRAGNASIAAVDLRQQIGFDRLYSTAFNVKARGNYVVFSGGGWGHGVGMEQWGAYGMAKEGKSARQIVDHYFPRMQWTQLYK